MLGERAIEFYRQGYSCSRCIMKAAESEYGISAKDTMKALAGINNGLGIGAMCSIPITCILVLGLLYTDENTIKQKRLEFLIRFKNEFKAFNCSEIQKQVCVCDTVIKAGCDILAEIVEK